LADTLFDDAGVMFGDDVGGEFRHVG